MLKVSFVCQIVQKTFAAIRRLKKPGESPREIR